MRKPADSGHSFPPFEGGGFLLPEDSPFGRDTTGSHLLPEDSPFGRDTTGSHLLPEDSPFGRDTTGSHLLPEDSPFGRDTTGSHLLPEDSPFGRDTTGSHLLPEESPFGRDTTGSHLLPEESPFGRDTTGSHAPRSQKKLDLPEHPDPLDVKARVRSALERRGQDLMRAEEREIQRAAKPPVKRFSTDYCIAWGRAQGWKLLDRERYDHRNKRHHDLMLGADAMFESEQGVVLIQGAGKGERKTHRARFEERGGSERLARLSVRFFYLEFLRDSKTPILTEEWHEA